MLVTKYLLFAHSLWVIGARPERVRTVAALTRTTTNDRRSTGTTRTPKDLGRPAERSIAAQHRRVRRREPESPELTCSLRYLLVELIDFRRNGYAFGCNRAASSAKVRWRDRWQRLIVADRREFARDRDETILAQINHCQAVPHARLQFAIAIKVPEIRQGLN